MSFGTNALFVVSANCAGRSEISTLWRVCECLDSTTLRLLPSEQQPPPSCWAIHIVVLVQSLHLRVHILRALLHVRKGWPFASAVSPCLSSRTSVPKLASILPCYVSWSQCAPYSTHSRTGITVPSMLASSSTERSAEALLSGDCHRTHLRARLAQSAQQLRTLWDTLHTYTGVLIYE